MTKQTALGHWWIAGEGSTKTPGLLEWDGEVDRPASLELLGSYPSNESNENGYAPLLLGIAKGNSYNLLHCTDSGIRNPSPYSSSPNQRWNVGNVAVGYHMESLSDTFTHCLMTLDGLGGWITAEELTAARLRAGEEASGKPASHSAVTVATFQMSEAVVQLEVSSDHQKRFGILADHFCFLSLTMDRPRSFDELKNEYVLPIQSLVSVATGSRGSVKTAYFYPNGNHWLNFSGGTWTGQRTFVNQWLIRPLFSAHQLETTIGRSLDRWLQIYGDHTYAFNAFQGLPLLPEAPQETVVFMTLVSCLESLLDTEERLPKSILTKMKRSVRELLPETVRSEVLQDMNSLSRRPLRSRLKKYVHSIPELFGEMATSEHYLDWTVDKIISTRNCAAHSTPEQCKKAAKGDELRVLHDSVRLMVNARVLALLGFSNEQIVRQFEDSYFFGTVDRLNAIWALTSSSA